MSFIKTLKSKISKPKNSKKMASESHKDNHVAMNERYLASMVLSGVGDALGYHNGHWEFCQSGKRILEELEQMGGLSSITIDEKQWRVSDDTVMHLATADALVACQDDDKTGDKESRLDKLYHSFAKEYKDCRDDMSGRAPGGTCMSSIRELRPSEPKGYQIPFNARHGGCGAAMRAMCIGLYYYRPSDLDELIEVSIESGRMTHNCPAGYLGSLASALFTHYAINDKPIREWGAGLMDVLSKAQQYVSKNREAPQNKLHWNGFTKPWRKFLAIRGIKNGDSDPNFDTPKDFENVTAREKFYNEEFSFDGWAGASGHDAPLIAYDAMLACNGSWERLCFHAMLHGGDNDSTGAIAGAWFGALYGFTGVPKCHYEQLEYLSRLQTLGDKLYKRRDVPDESPPAAHAALGQGTPV